MWGPWFWPVSWVRAGTRAGWRWTVSSERKLKKSHRPKVMGDVRDQLLMWYGTGTIGPPWMRRVEPEVPTYAMPQVTRRPELSRTRMEVSVDQWSKSYHEGEVPLRMCAAQYELMCRGIVTGEVEDMV
jgi:hypothetical protein